jgi:hypothetical protein
MIAIDSSKARMVALLVLGKPGPNLGAETQPGEISGLTVLVIDREWAAFERWARCGEFRRRRAAAPRLASLRPATA